MRPSSAAVGASLLLALGACAGETYGSPDRPVPFAGHIQGDFEDEDIPAPTEEQKRLVPKAHDLPIAVTMGHSIDYVVELHNPTDDAISLHPCPGFYQAWGESGTAVFGPGVLNCEQAPDTIGAGDSVWFEMSLAIPEDVDGVDCFEGSVIWYLGSSGDSSEWTGSDVIEACRRPTSG